MSGNDTVTVAPDANKIRHLIGYVFAGCGLSTACVLVAIIYFVGTPRLRIKRMAIVTVNVCFSLLIFYIGYIIFMAAGADIECFKKTNTMSMQCTLGALLMLFSWICMAMWLVIEWGYFAYTLRRPITKHISNFCIKTTSLVYSSSTALLVVLMIIYFNKDNMNSTTDQPATTLPPTVTSPSTNSTLTTVEPPKSKPLMKIVTTILGIFLTVILLTVVYCAVRIFRFPVNQTPQMKLRKAKKQFVRLLAVTVTIGGTNAPFIILWNTESAAQTNIYISVVAASSICNAIQGILIAFFVIVHRDDDRLHRASARRQVTPTGGLSVDAERSESVGQNPLSARFSTCDDPLKSPKFQPRDSKPSMTPDDSLFLALSPTTVMKDRNLRISEENLHGGAAHSHQVTPPTYTARESKRKRFTIMPKRRNTKGGEVKVMRKSKEDLDRERKRSSSVCVTTPPPSDQFQRAPASLRSLTPGSIRAFSPTLRGNTGNSSGGMHRVSILSKEISRKTDF